MEKVIIIKRPDGLVDYIRLGKSKFQDKEELKDSFIEENCKELKRYKSLGFNDYIITTLDKIPKDKESRRQRYFDGNVLKIDENWDRNLMPPKLIVRKHISRIDKKIDAELLKPNSSAISVIKLLREREAIHLWNEKKIYSQALLNLDEDGIQKPVIRQKLLEKTGN